MGLGRQPAAERSRLREGRKGRREEGGREGGREGGSQMIVPFGRTGVSSFSYGACASAQVLRGSGGHLRVMWRGSISMRREGPPS